MSAESKAIQVISFDDKKKNYQTWAKKFVSGYVKGVQHRTYGNRSKSTQAKQSNERHGQRFIEAT